VVSVFVNVAEKTAFGVGCRLWVEEDNEGALCQLQRGLEFFPRTISPSAFRASCQEGHLRGQLRSLGVTREYLKDERKCNWKESLMGEEYGEMELWFNIESGEEDREASLWEGKAKAGFQEMEGLQREGAKTNASRVEVRLGPPARSKGCFPLQRTVASYPPGNCFLIASLTPESYFLPCQRAGP
jgi:hypothetical protein